MKRAGALLLILVIAASFVIGGRWVWQWIVPPSPLKRIERVIHETADAIEKESLIAIAPLIADDFRGGGVDKAGALAMLQRLFAQADRLEVQILRVMHEDAALPADADRAHAIVIAQISGVENTDMQAFRGIAGPADALLVEFTQQDGRWRVASARHLDTTDVRQLERQLHGAD